MNDVSANPRGRATDPVLIAAGDAVRGCLGPRVSRLLLVGARTRQDGGDRRYELVALLCDDDDRAGDQQRVDMALQHIARTLGVVMECRLAPQSALRHRTGFIWNMLSEALDI